MRSIRKDSWQLEMEKLSLGRESDPGSKERRSGSSGNWPELANRPERPQCQWQKEKGAIGPLRLKEVDRAGALQVEQAKRSYDLNRPPSWSYGTLADPTRSSRQGGRPQRRNRRKETCCLRRSPGRHRRGESPSDRASRWPAWCRAKWRSC